MSAYAKLRRKRQLFVDAYVRTGSGSEAARESGYGGRRVDVAGSKMLANLEVKAAIAERTEEALARAGIRQVRVLEEIARMAFASNAQVRHPDGTVRAFKDLPADFLAGSEAIEFNSDGTLKKVHLAKGANLERLGKYLKLFADVHEHQGRGGGPIETKDLTDVSELEKARRIAFLLHQGLRAQRAPTPLDDESVSGDEPDVTM